MEWNSDMTLAPRDGTVIRIRPRYGLPEMNGRWRVYENGRAGFAFICGRDVNPTHWAPLPQLQSTDR